MLITPKLQLTGNLLSTIGQLAAESKQTQENAANLAAAQLYIQQLETGISYLVFTLKLSEADCQKILDAYLEKAIQGRKIECENSTTNDSKS